MIATTAPKILNAAKVGIAATRQMSAISGPPTVRISFAEKIAHGTVIAVSVLAMPAWVLTHVRKYRGLS